MTGKFFVLIGSATMFLVIAGCGGPNMFCAGPNTFCPGPGRLDTDYGTSYKLAMFNQTLNPDAEKNLEPVIRFDGGAAKTAIERYRKGFEEMSTAPIYSINIGGFTK